MRNQGHQGSLARVQGLPIKVLTAEDPCRGQWSLSRVLVAAQHFLFSDNPPPKSKYLVSCREAEWSAFCFVERVEVHAHMLHRSRLLAVGTHLPLQKLALCLDCDECFELGYATCPACGSSTWSPLARFFDLVSGSRECPAGESARGMLRRRSAETIAIA